MEFLQFILALAMLLAGGRLLVAASVDIARRLGVRPLLIGLTIVAWGTSGPELAFNLTAAIRDKPDLVFGNVVGANIANLGLVLGLAAILAPIGVDAVIVRREVPIMVGMFAVFGVLAVAPGLTTGATARLDGVVLLAMFAAYSTYAIRAGLRSRREDAALIEDVQEVQTALSGRPASISMLALAGGMALLALGGNLGSEAASAVARDLGMSDRVVGLTVVSIGTTLPELVTSITAVRRGQQDLAVGNAIGSCLFNAGVIYGLASFIEPAPLPLGATPSVIAMTVLGLLMWPMGLTSNRRLRRSDGLILLAVYGGFIGFELWRTRQAGDAAGPASPVAMRPVGRPCDARAVHGIGSNSGDI